MATKKTIKRRKRVTDIPHKEFLRILQRMGACPSAQDWVIANQFTMREAWLNLQRVVWADMFICAIGGKFTTRALDIIYPCPRPEWWWYIKDNLDSIRLDRFRQAMPFKVILRAVRRKFPKAKQARRKKVGHQNFPDRGSGN